MSDTQRDRELARRAAGGDEAAWRSIYDSTCDRLFSLLCYQLGDRQEAMDLLQDTYVRAYTRLSSYRGEAPLSAWIRTIAVRLAADWKRSALQKIKRTVGITERTAIVEPDVEGIRFSSETRELETALSRLSTNQRAVLLLHDWEGLSFQEISEALGCKESTVRVHHVRAKQKMRDALGTSSLEAQPTGAEGLGL
ncbi:MAG: RNA polymerase sigma factor [Candidatus Eisenbacteria bacterium]|uniref:RNA polymerase sigma factor n=1 Tax=Eiseniibacteriota bacterium TaxID=2212470 RepID=A0A956SD82_UNCEI|nr:RNA polymerase sigma factor [Candidatus Eisenbacteria bacterium]MCB9463330.1 RNA polymerase sigma factor [Candidatus Eisenbacteria bacterium]